MAALLCALSFAASVGGCGASGTQTETGAPAPAGSQPAEARGGPLELPAELPGWRYRSYRRVGKGLFLVGIDPRGDDPWLVVFDTHGRARWWYRPSTPVLQSMILSNGEVEWARSFHDGYGVNPKMADEVHSLSGKPLGLIRTVGTITDGHELQPDSEGDVYVDSYAIRDGIDLHRFGGPRDTAVAFAEIQELNRAGKVLWRWNSAGHIGLGETGRWWQHNVLKNPHEVDGRQVYDAVHINAIDPHGKLVIISTRHTDAVFAIDRRTGKIVWKLGGTPTGRSLKVIGDPYSPELFGGQHDVRFYANDLLSVYDDSTHRDRPPRAAFYRIDARKGTATFLGQLTDPLVKESHCCGSVRPLAGGWLVDWGDNPLVTEFDRRGRIVFRLHLASSSYRAVPLPPDVTAHRLRRAMLER